MSKNTPHHIWRMPLVLVALIVMGLLAGLLGDGAMDALSWLGLGVPTAITVWIAFWGRSQKGR